ncbi:phosphotransferase enzyme family protein [Streptomyces sp. JNUCC 64]
MRDRPAGVSGTGLRKALGAWGVTALSLDHAPVGFGDHHWIATGSGGRRWFLTVADLTNKPHCGDGVRAAYEGLVRAMDTALALRGAGLALVVAPLPAGDGATVHRLDERYALSVLPWVDARSGEFGQRLTDGERTSVARTLAGLHRTPGPAPARVLPVALPGHDRLAAALDGTDGPWARGPYAGPARRLLRERGRTLRARLAEFDRRARALEARGDRRVVTHGEPHPGNLLWEPDGGVRLVDWDTCGLAVPERDLWHVAARDDGGFDTGVLSAWAGITGRDPDPAALELYRTRWALDDVAAFLEVFRAPHGRSPDTGTAWRGLTWTVDRLTDG